MSEQDTWDADDFEDSVATGLIACYESKIKKEKLPSFVRIGPADLTLMRKLGPYFPGNDRVMHYVPEAPEFDLVNDPLPSYGCICARNWANKGKPGAVEGYAMMALFRRIPRLPKEVIRTAKGTDYELACITPGKGRITGEKHFLTVDGAGVIRSADQAVIKTLAFSHRQITVKQSEHEPHILAEREIWLSTAMQFIADSRFTWSITASEKEAKTTLGCTQEEIKSLMYARTLPLTVTGRKRPILHLIESHKRRLKNGIEIDIVPFLKGTQIVDINGTAFKVNPPMVKKPIVSVPSQERYYEKA
jgi:hypothetical protein